MTSFKILLIVTIASLSNVHSKPSKHSPEECKQLLAKVDEGLRHLLMINETAIVPGNKAKLDDYCKIVTPINKIAGQYLKCESGLRRQLVAVFKSAIVKPTSFICKKKREESMKSFACFDDEYINEVLKNSNFLTYNYKILSEKVELDDIVPTFCCSTTIYMNTLMNIKSPKCKDSSLNAKIFYHNRVASAMNDLLDLLCGSHKSLAQCEEKSPEIVKKLAKPIPSDYKPIKVPLTSYILNAFGKIA